MAVACDNAALFDNIGKNPQLWSLIDEDISRLPRLTMMLIHHIGWNHCAESAVAAMRPFISDLPSIPTQKGVFVTINQKGRLCGCLGSFAGKDGYLLERIMQYTLKSAFEDRRFHAHPLRTPEGVVEVWETSHWSFTTTVLDCAFDVEVKDFWEKYQPGGHGIIFEYRGRSATFLPKVMMRWWPEEGFVGGAPSSNSLTPSQRKQFEEELFGALLDKMGYPRVSPKKWKDGSIQLYNGTEYHDE